MRKMWNINLVMLGMGLLVSSCANTKQEGTNKVDAWIHLHPNGLSSRFEECKEFGRRAKAAGYSTVMIRFTNHRGYNKESARKLIHFYKHDLGLNVIPEFKLLGKSKKTYGRKFVEDHPELFIGEVIDPYATYQGKTAFDSLIIPLVDEHIDIFEKPEYFMLGWDEYNTDNIKKVAERNNKTISEVWAGTLNRVNDYLLSKNITPIIFGDQLISKQLASNGNPAGYPADKRFEIYSAMHGIFPPQNKTDMIKYARDIRNRDKIVMADWHYEDETEYPSVEYFNWLGFKEIIPVTWGKDGNMKHFSKYAQLKGIKKMMASVWHYSYHPSVRHLLWPTVDNSILYFNNPDMEIPEMPKLIVMKDGKPVISAMPGDTLTLRLTPSGNKAEFDLYPVNKMLRKNVITLKGNNPEVTWRIPADAKEGLWTIQGYSKRKDGYLLHGMLEAGLFINKKTFSAKRLEDSSFISANFSNCERFGNRKQYVVLNGSSNTNFGTLEGDAIIKEGALACKKGGLLVGRSNFDVDVMKKNKTAMVEFTVNQFPSKKQEWAGVLTWGHYGTGFRIIIWHKKLHVQLFGAANKIVSLISKSNLETGKKYLVIMNMNNMDATLFLNGVEQMKKPALLSNKIAVTDPLCVGCSYQGGLWKCFNGTINRFAVWNKFVDKKTATK